jgi:hypothetical protein
MRGLRGPDNDGLRHCNNRLDSPAHNINTNQIEFVTKKSGAL